MSVVSKFVFDGNVVTDGETIAENFNKFYINIGPSLAAKLPHSPKSPISFMPAANPSSMFVEPVSPEEITKIIKALKNSSAGWDSIHAKIVKITYNKYLTALNHVLNLSLQQGIFPNELKLARVIPLFKADDCMLINNYRPVSILPLFSKIYERIMYNRLWSFIKKHNLLYKYQFGFREKHGTDVAVIVLIDKIMSAFNDGEMVLRVFLDFSKAFDTVDHKILLSKLYHYGIRGLALDWFKSYLTDRKQFVSFNGSLSKEDIIKCGVPQGSILGPLLFLLYINDMVNASVILFALLFADDTSVFVSGKNLCSLIEIMNNELGKLAEWMCINKLSLNVKKTKFMLFTIRNVPISDTLYINGETIERVDNFKFLGVLIDAKLTWNDHVQFI